MAQLSFGFVKVVVAALQLYLAGTRFPKYQQGMGISTSWSPMSQGSREWGAPGAAGGVCWDYQELQSSCGAAQITLGCCGMEPWEVLRFFGFFSVFPADF